MFVAGGITGVIVGLVAITPAAGLIRPASSIGEQCRVLSVLRTVIIFCRSGGLHRHSRGGGGFGHDVIGYGLNVNGHLLAVYVPAIQPTRIFSLSAGLERHLRGILQKPERYGSFASVTFFVCAAR